MPKHFQNHVVWSRTLNVYCEVTCDRALNQMLYQIIRGGPLQHGNIINQRLRDFIIPWSPNFVLGPTSKRWLLKIVQVTMKHDPFYAM